MFIGRVTAQLDDLLVEHLDQFMLHEQVTAEILPILQVHDVAEDLVDVDRLVHLLVVLLDFRRRVRVQHHEVRRVDFEELARDHALQHELRRLLSG